MRFRSLSIPAFGPFTGFSASYERGEADFHLVFGPNEAGKSSLLRAITALLYGIPVRSADNFLHDYSDLRLAAEIENRLGKRLSFNRSKGRKNTIRGDDGVALDDSVLAPFLSGVDEPYFNQVFGLDSEELQTGAESLLNRDGDLSQALLATSTGGSLVQQAHEQFVHQSERYYRGRAQKDVSIRPALKELKDQQRAVREHSVATREWEQLEKQLAEKQTATATLNDARIGLERQLDWLTRCQDALPTVAQFKSRMSQLDELPSLPQLRSDFPARARRAHEDDEQARTALQREQRNVARLQEQLIQCATSPPVLAEAAALDDLHARVEIYRTRLEKLTDTRHQMAAQQPQLKAGMLTFGLTGPVEALETLRIAPAALLAFDESAEVLQQAQLAAEKNHNDSANLNRSIEQDQAALAPLADESPQALQAACDSAADVRQQYQNLPKLKAQAEQLQRQLQQARALLPGVNVDVDALATLPIPAAATIRRFRESLADGERELKQLNQHREQLVQQQQELRNDLQQLQQSGELPSLQALTRVRRERDSLWQQVVADWQRSIENDDSEIDFGLQLSFPAAIIDADRLADALRENANQVARAGQLRQQLKACESETKQLDDSLRAIKTGHRGEQGRWQAQWSNCGLTAASPVEMEQWREHWIDYRELSLELSNVSQELQRQQQLVTQATEQLASALNENAAGDFDALFRIAREQLQAQNAAIGQRKEIEDRIHRQTIQLEQMQSDATRLQRQHDHAAQVWARRCSEMGLPRDATVRTGNKLMQQRTELLTRFDQWQTLSAEAIATEKEVHSFEHRVDEFSAKLAVGGDSVLAREGAMWTVLKQARLAQQSHNTLTDQLQHAQEGLDQARLQAQQAADRLGHIKTVAQLPVTGELEPLVAMIERRERLSQDVETHRQALIGLARGEAIAEFILRVEAEDGELLSSTRANVERERSDILEQLQHLRDEAGGIQRELDHLARANDQAALHQQQMESINAVLSHDAREFILLRIAATFLDQQREKYREQNQAPLLAASSRIFKSVTLNAFERLAPDYDARDEAVIVGERADGSRVPVEGMSEGTRDQLYLSLRLAALEQHMKTSEPMPLIMDDLLMTFDDQRSTAMLQQIAGLAQHTQIFLFTHHQHVVELCRRVLDENQFTLHQL